VVENLAERLAASQSGVVHPVQLLPYVPVSLWMVEQVLDKLATSDFVEKDRVGDFVSYHFPQFVDRPQTAFKPERCVFSNAPLPEDSAQVLSEDVIREVENELRTLAESDPWPANANWQHELVYLMQNLSGSVRISDLAGHSRMAFRQVEEKVKQLAKLGAVSLDPNTGTVELPPLAYPQSQYERQAAFIRLFPGALKEEYEVRLVRALLYVIGIMVLCFLAAFFVRVPFFILLIFGVVTSGVTFLRILRAAPQPLPKT
tara:strand:+ start:1836 stop:2612 length:777 start_codon:yes stop_codon:yes gene_type:complete